MSTIVFPGVDDPFAELDVEAMAAPELIHIRIQQRNGRKMITTVQGIPEKYELKQILKAFKKTFACNGCIVNHYEYGEVIQLQGDQRETVCEFLLQAKVADKEQLKVHGY